MREIYNSQDAELLAQTIADLFETLSEDDIKPADYLRLLELRDELEADTVLAMRAGWVLRRPQ